MNTPNPGFVRTLQMMDEQLSVYWGDYINQWVVARTGIISTTEIRYLRSRAQRLAELKKLNKASKHEIGVLAEVQEELKCALTGRRVIRFSETLDRRLYDELALSDIKSYGGYSRFCDELENFESRKQNEKKRVRDNKLLALNKEMYDVINFLDRKKSAEMAHGERNLNKLLHGKKEEKRLFELQSF